MIATTFGQLTCNCKTLGCGQDLTCISIGGECGESQQIDAIDNKFLLLVKGIY